MTTMPKFNFSGCSIKDDAQLADELAKAGTDQSKIFKPGKHDVVIKEAVFDGMLPKDPTWGKMKVTFQGTNDKTINAWVCFPTSDIYYGEKKTLFMFNKFKSFCASLGEDVKASNIESVLKKTIGKPEKLAGKPLAIKVGYEKARASYAGKSADGSVLLNLELADGSKYQENGQVKVFTDADSKAAYKAVETFANEKKIAFDAFAQVLDYFPSDVEAKKDEMPWQ